MELLLVIVSLGACAFFCLSRYVWTVSLGVLLIVSTGYAWLSLPSFIFCWLIYLSLLVFTYCQPLRLRMLSRNLYRYTKKILPPMSETESIALDAGDVWWEGECFRGKPDWAKLHAMPRPILSEEEQAFLDNEVNTLCSMVDDWDVVERRADLPQEVWTFIKDKGFFGLVIPKEYGGKGFSALMHSAVVTKLGSRSPSLAVTVMVPNSLGPAELIFEYGTDEQKQHYLPRLATGKDIPCFGLTGVEAGSDATAITDTGIVCNGTFEGKDVIGLKLNFDKRYITLAPVATVLGLAVKVCDPDHLLGGDIDLGISLCLVPRDAAGVEVGSRHYPSRMAFMNGPMRGKDVFIPLDWIIGGQENIGQGWRMLMESLSVGRSISLPALSTAVSQLSMRTTSAYTQLRRQFKLPIAKFEGIAEAMARIIGLTYTVSASRSFTANAIDMGVRPSLASAIAKYNMTEMARTTINDALDVHAGRGIQMGPSNYLAYHYMAAPIMITVEGANILTRNMIIFGQGAMRCHPFVRDEMAAIADPDEKAGLKQFDKLLLSHIGFTLSNAVRSFVYGITGGYFIMAPTKMRLAKYYRQVTRMSCAFALTADIAMMLLGGQLKRKERLSARFADILSQLYLASAVLKRFYDRDQNENEQAIAQWSLQMCLHNIQQHFDALLHNFPQRGVAFLLRAMIFPFGRSYRAPSDTLSQEIVEKIMTDQSLREQLSRLCYVGETADDPTGCVELAMQQWFAVSTIDAKIKKAMANGKIKANGDISKLYQNAVAANIISNDEKAELDEYEKARWQSIQVDEFPFDYFSRNEH